jgi:hypothetical protein
MFYNVGPRSVASIPTTAVAANTAIRDRAPANLPPGNNPIKTFFNLQTLAK